MIRVCFLFCLVLVLASAGHAQRDLTRYVDPFIGTGGHGHTYPGATVPFGMVQLSPDTRLTGWDGCSGYHYSDKALYGFSHTHLSGTGISDYGDILFVPVLEDVFLRPPHEQNSRNYGFSHSNEKAEPGYYAVKLDNGIFAELTTTSRVGFHRYNYPSAAISANLLIDLTHRDRVLDSYLRIVDSTHVEGFRLSQAWARDQIVFFVAEFSQEISSFGIANPVFQDSLREAQGTDIKAFLRFRAPSKPLLVKVAISAVSIEGARRNLQTELPHWEFDRVRTEAKQAWNAELNKIAVRSDNQTQLKTFYTALYHTMIAPNLFMDVDGQYRGVDKKIHAAKAFDNYTVFSLWDTFRAAHPLYTIIDRKRTLDFIKTFLAQYREGGRLPVWELSANETDTMIGYHAVSVIADAATKGIVDFDLDLALAAMKHSADLAHFGLADYKAHGYIDMEQERESVSRTLEYAYDDWCIAQMARLIGRTEDFNRFIRRAQTYQNVFDVKSGFMRPRSNGGWSSPFDPREVTFSFTEANSWQYTFFVPHDISGLIDLMGGPQKFARKLDEMFAAESKTTGREQADITGLMGQYAHGNEPSHHIAYLYNYVGQPWKTQSRVRLIMDQFYKPEPDGLIGNEDCGQMSAWYVLSAAGLYPVTPGNPIYVIGSPIFAEVRFNLENGKSFVIKAKSVSDRNLYIQSATLNGKQYQKSFITHGDVMAGGELTFVMGAQPNTSWGTGDGNAPVSAITEQRIVPVPVVEAPGKTFKDRARISFSVPNNRKLQILYSADGSQPLTFAKPFEIDRSTTIRAWAIDRDGHQSQIATARLQKIPHNWSLRLESKYSSQYSGAGDLALIDGIRGTRNFSGGGWQGYQGQDLVAVVDLGTAQSVSKLGAGFLQDVGSWIVMPPTIEFELSLDGSQFTPVLSIPTDVSDRNYDLVIKEFVGSISPQKARFVRIKARSYGKLPSWHAGSGGDSWIFADEIVIE